MTQTQLNRKARPKDVLLNPPSRLADGPQWPAESPQTFPVTLHEPHKPPPKARCSLQRRKHHAAGQFLAAGRPGKPGPMYPQKKTNRRTASPQRPAQIRLQATSPQTKRLQASVSRHTHKAEVAKARPAH